MTRSVQRFALALFVSVALASPSVIEWRLCFAQEELIVRPGPPPVDDLETDKNKDGIPDGWYNVRDIKWMTEGGAAGPHFVRFRMYAAWEAGAAEPCLRCRRQQDRGPDPWLLDPPEHQRRR